MPPFYLCQNKEYFILKTSFTIIKWIDNYHDMTIKKSNWISYHYLIYDMSMTIYSEKMIVKLT